MPTKESMFMDHVQSALIVGGGIGGMATAIRLAELGVAVTLIDLDSEWRVYGAGITITGPTLRAYKRLGLLDQIKERGAITNGTRLRHFTGPIIRELDEPALEEGLPATGGIMRPVLHHIMQERIRELPVEVRLGVSVTALDNTDTGVTATFTDGSSADYDLVVGSDSVFSVVRKIAFPHMGEPEETGQGCWRVSMKRPPDFEFGEFYFGHKYTAGITACGPDSIYLFLLTPHVERETFMTDEELFDTMREHLADFGGNVGWVRDTMTREDWINYRPLAAKLQPAPWYNGRIVLLGDSVHATTPHLASGAGMAVESAMVLAEELEKAGDVPTAFAAYQERRFDRCKHVVDSSVKIGALQLAGGSPEEIGGLIGGALHRLAGEY